MTNTNEWEREFEEKFAGLSSTLFGDVKGMTRDFIRSLLSRHDKERTAEVVEKVNYELAHDSSLADEYIHAAKNSKSAPFDKGYTFGRKSLANQILTALRSPEGGEETCEDFHDLTKGMAWTPCGLCGRRRDENPKGPNEN